MLIRSLRCRPSVTYLIVKLVSKLIQSPLLLVSLIIILRDLVGLFLWGYPHLCQLPDEDILIYRR